MMLRLSLVVLRLFARIVPRRERDAWLREWEAEIHERGRRLAAQRRRRRQELDLFRRTLGSFYDAAWLRRQLTLDAEFVHDVRFGARLLRLNPGVALLAVALLSLGIGGTVAVYSVVDTLLVRDLPYRDADRIVTLWQTDIGRQDEREGVSPGAFLDWLERSRSFSILAAAEPLSFDYLSGPEPITLVAAGVTEGFFEALGVSPALGRTFVREDHEGEFGAPVAVLSDGAWRRYFGADPAVIGRQIVLDGRTGVVVGVLPRSFHPDILRRAREQEVWVPQAARAFERENRRTRYWSAVGRLAPGVTLEQARAEFATISSQLALDYPRTLGRSTATLVPFRENLAGPVRQPLIILFGAAVMVLLLSCANVASLLLARALARQREFALRAAIGAGRLRLLRQMLGESLVLALGACAGGMGLAYVAVSTSGLRSAIPVSQLADLKIDGRIALFAAALTLATTILVGLVPAIRLSRAGARAALEDAAASVTAGPRRRRLTSMLVVAEVGLALIVVVSAGLLVRSFLTIASVDPGFVRSNVAALQVFAYGERYQTDDQTLAFFNDTLGRFSSMPGVEATGLVSAMPFIPANINIEGGFRVEGRPELPANEQPTTHLTLATGGYFTAMRIPIKRGRLFTDQDDGRSRPVAIVNELLANRFWPDGDPVGDRVTVNWLGQWRTLEVVGVVGGMRHETLDGDPRPEVFMPFAQAPFGSMTFVVRTATDPAPFIPALKNRLWEVDPTLPLYDTATVDGLVAESLAPRRFVTDIVGGLAALAFVLAACGVYAVVSFSTAQRTREFALRIAIGGTTADIRRMVILDNLPLVAGGLVVGLLGSAAATSILSGLLYGVSASDPLTIGASSAMLAAVAALACDLPARRATRADPLTSLRAQ